MRRLKKLITDHRFTERFRGVTILGANVRLNGVDSRIELVRTAGAYPTAGDLFAKTRLLRPKTMKQVIGFEATAVTPPGTSVRFRLSGDGVEELFWDGAAWSQAASGEWSTEAEVAAHIDAFPVAKRGIQVVMNLATTDPKATPFVTQVKVLWTSDIDFQEDYIVRGLIPYLRGGVTPIAEYQVASNGGTTVDMSVLETPYNITGIDSVYDITADPDMLVDTYVSWNGATKTITCAPAASGHQRFVRFIYSPVIALATDQEYSEVAKVPAINLEGVTLINRRPMCADGETVLNKAAGTGWKLTMGFQADIQVRLRVITDKGKDLQRTSEAISGLLETVKAIHSPGLDEDFTIKVESPYANDAQPAQGGLHAGRITVRIVDAVFYLVDAVQVFGATQPMKMGAGGNLQFG